MCVFTGVACTVGGTTVLCTTPACFSTFFQSTMVSTLVKIILVYKCKRLQSVIVLNLNWGIKILAHALSNKTVQAKNNDDHVTVYRNINKCT